MSMEKPNAELLKEAAQSLNPHLKFLHLVVRLLRTLSPAILLAFALFGLGLAIWFGLRLERRLTEGQAIVANGLHANLETTSHPHKGIAAFLLSGLEKDLQRDTQGTEARVQEAIDEIEAELRRLQQDSKAFNVDQALDSLTPVQLEVTKPDEESAWQKMIVAKRDPTRFLMVPALSLRRASVSEPPLKDSEIPKVLRGNPEVLFDLYAAIKLETSLRKLDHGLSVQSQPIVQTYFITESGVISLHATKIQDQFKYYSDQFKTYTLFMDRSYFWRAVDPDPGEGKGVPKPFDYRSEPYIDLGGNGLVVTYSRRLELPNKRAAVICLDVRLPDTLVTKMKERLTTLGANFDEFNWGTSSEGVVPEEFNWFKRESRKSLEQSKFLGAIQMDPDWRNTESDALKFTIPLDSWETAPGQRVTNLLWVKVDFKKIRSELTFDVAMFLVGVVLLVLLSWTMFLEYKVLGREMTAVLKKMTKVMREASTPFAWLNETNSFVDVNHEFLRVLEYENIEQLKREMPTFRALITAEYQPVYQNILDASGQGVETDKYEVNVVTSTKRIIKVVVHGERVPYPTFFKRTLPHRFGVFLDVIDPETMQEQPEETAPKPTPVLKALAKHA